MKRLFIVALLALSACATAPQSPAQAVYAAHGNYAAALTVAVAYRRLPPCAPSGPPLCSDKRIVADLQKADNVAFDALSAAQRVARAPGAGANVQTAINAANQAIGAFSSITASLQVN